MKCGVVYRFKPHNKINGTLFYCYEYCQTMRELADAKLYIIGATPDDMQLINNIFVQKYVNLANNIVPLNSVVELYALQLDRTLVLDVKTFYDVKEFLTNDIVCFSNDTHPMFRYKNDRRVTYYGIYDYQRYDHPAMLKLGFHLFKPCKSQPGVFVSTVNSAFLKQNRDRLAAQFNKPIILKENQFGAGDIFDKIDAVHYVHYSRDTNNRIIPEAFFHGKIVTMEQPHPLPIDSVQLRYHDIAANGLGRYTLTTEDEMIQHVCNT